MFFMYAIGLYTVVITCMHIGFVYKLNFNLTDYSFAFICFSLTGFCLEYVPYSFSVYKYTNWTWNAELLLFHKQLLSQTVRFIGSTTSWHALFYAIMCWFQDLTVYCDCFAVCAKLHGLITVLSASIEIAPLKKMTLYLLMQWLQLTNGIRFEVLDIVNL